MVEKFTVSPLFDKEIEFLMVFLTLLPSFSSSILIPSANSRSLQ